MRILFLASRELSYQRLDVLLRAFQRFASVQVLGYSTPASLIKRSIQISIRSIPLLASGQYDLVFVGFYGHLMMLPVGLLAGRPVLFDAFVSTYDTLCFDRGQFSPRSLPGRLAYKLDQWACQLANKIVLDTDRHASYFQETFHLPAGKLSSIPVGCNEDLFHPKIGREAEDKFTVLYYCTYMPLHGVETVVQAASLLRSLPIAFKLVGSGPQYQAIRQLADDLRLRNIEFVSFVPLNQLPFEIASAQICLGGHFGSSEKARRVIPGKIYQILAMVKPLIAADTPANADLLTSQETAWLCPPGDATALAKAIDELYHKPELRTHLSISGRKLFEIKCSEKYITDRLRQISVSIVDSLK